MSEGEEIQEGGGMMKLKSFIHEHPLTLLDGLINGKNCNECGLYITGPTYICNTPDCKFYIHRSCVELPSQIYHPLHPNHPLILAKPPSPPTFYGGVFYCELCIHVRDGFSFYCAECHYALDAYCALNIPTVLEHVLHEHPLNLSPPNSLTAYATEPYFHCTRPNCKHILEFGKALLPPVARHRTHRHQLKLTFLPPSEDDNPEEEEEYCDACEELRSVHGLLYCCQECDFTAHTSCMASPPLQLFPPAKPLATFKVQNHDHVLTLLPEMFRRCTICQLFHYMMPYYGCEACEYNVSITCATKLGCTSKVEDEEKEEEEEVTLFEERKLEKGIMMDIRQMHQHPLAFSVKQYHRCQRCNVCRLPISGANYYCNDCVFFLHESCTQLPIEMEYMINTPQAFIQNLILAKPPSPLYLNDMFLCSICNTPGDGFSYHSLGSWYPSTLFVCHVNCALNIPYALTHKCHKHPLTLRSNSVFNNHLCCACGTKINDTAYLCIMLDTALHVECAHLPATRNHESHPHLLNLTKTIQVPFYCDVCGEKREWKGWAYACQDCKFTAHVRCICEGDLSPYMDLGGTLEHQNHEHLLTLTRRSEDMSQCSHCDEPLKTNLVFQCVKCNYNLDLKCASKCAYAKPLGWTLEEEEGEGKGNGGEKVGGSEMATEVEHFSHVHPLVLLDTQTNRGRCSGCRLAISGGPNYGCAECNISLHKSCLELPRKIMFPLHGEHSLILSKDPPSPFKDGIFYCCLCGTPGDGFSFSCAQCDKIVLHVHCALRTPMEIRVAAHEHLLTLDWCSYDGGNAECAACKRTCEGAIFSCHKCVNPYDLHATCATLPPQKKYRSHRHVLTFKYHHLEEESNEYYCDACEEERIPETWVYRCEESKQCDFVAHTSCEPFPFLELGGTRKIGSHDHPLALVVKKEDIHRYTMEGILSGLRYQCTECTYKFDFIARVHEVSDD